MRYVAVIGDLVASREAGNRGELQRVLAGAVEQANVAARERLASPYTITLGDEFQALYRSPEALLGDFWALLDALHPVRLRLAAGIGEIATPINDRQALGMDGPAFYRARRTMDELKRERDSIVQLEGESGTLALVNPALRLVCRLIAGWKRETLSILIRLAEGLPVEEIARHMGVTERAVFKRIRTNSLREVLSVAGAVESELAAAMGEADEP